MDLVRSEYCSKRVNKNSLANLKNDGRRRCQRLAPHFDERLRGERRKIHEASPAAPEYAGLAVGVQEPHRVLYLVVGAHAVIEPYPPKRRICLFGDTSR
jgi:hypothetical protein